MAPELTLPSADLLKRLATPPRFAEFSPGDEEKLPAGVGQGTPWAMLSRLRPSPRGNPSPPPRPDHRPSPSPRVAPGGGLQLLYSRECCRSQAVRMYLEEKGVAPTLCAVDCGSAEDLEPSFLRLSPRGDTPVLLDGDCAITGVVDIARHVDRVGGRLGGAAMDPSELQGWADRILPHLGEQTMAYSLMAPGRARMLIRFKRKVCVERMARHPDLGREYSALLAKYQALDGQVCAGHAAEVEKRALGQLFKDVDKYLDAHGMALQPYLAGTEVSLADIALAVLLAKVHRLGLDEELLKKHSRLQEYWKKWRGRSSYRRVLGLVAMTSAMATRVGSTMTVKAKTLARRFE